MLQRPLEIIASMPDLSPATPLLFLREEELRQGFELLYFAHRDVSAEAEKLLEDRGLGLPHYRAILFIGRQNQITIGALLGILRITKQSLGRIIQQLMDQKLVSQRQGLNDRRQKMLSLTEAGKALEREIWSRQRAHIARAYRECGTQAIESFRKLLLSLITDADDRARFERTLPSSGNH